MLQSIRDKSQGIIALIIILILVLSFGLWGIHNYFYGSAAQQPIAKVNGTPISQQQFSSTFQRYRQAQLQQNPQLFSSQVAIAAMKKQLLDSMIQTTLLTQEAYHAGFRVGENLLTLSLAKMPIFQVDGQFSKFRFQQFLENMMYTQQEFLSQLKTSIILAQLQSGFTLTAFALPYQVDEAIKLINQERTFSYVEIPAKRFVDSVKVTPQMISSYYKSHQKEFILPEKVSVDYLSLSLNDLMKKINPSDAQLKNYYQMNINHYTEPKKWQLAHILVAVSPDAGQQAIAAAKQQADTIYKKLTSGASFAELAKQDSDDLATAKSGGEMKWQTLLGVNATWQHQLYNLNKVGQISKPFKTMQGYEILKLLAVKPAVVQPYDKVAAKVKSDYVKQQAEKKFADESDVLANLTFESPNTLAPAAKKLGLAIQSTALFSKAGGKTDLTKNPRLIHAAFSNSVLNQGNNSDVISITDSQVVVIRAKDKVAASTKSLESVKSQIAETLKQQQASEQALALSENVLKQLKAGKSLATLAETNHLTMHTTEKPVKRNSPSKTLDPIVITAAFHLQKHIKGTVSAVNVPVQDGGYAVVELHQVVPGNLAGKEQQAMRKYYVQGTEQSQGELDYALFVNGLHQAAKIKYYTNNDNS